MKEKLELSEKANKSRQGIEEQLRQVIPSHYKKKKNAMNCEHCAANHKSGELIIQTDACVLRVYRMLRKQAY